MIDHVIIERESESTIMFVEGAKDAYLGYVTLRVGIHDKHEKYVYLLFILFSCKLAFNFIFIYIDIWLNFKQF